MSMITVICRDFYTEHPPVRYLLNIDSELLAEECIIRRDWIKEILDVGKNIQWNKETAIKYWRTYSDDIDESKISDSYLKENLIR